ncbi:MAG: hypothetical protein AAGJ94_01315 [Pseudomonadota bacterium]
MSTLDLAPTATSEARPTQFETLTVVTMVLAGLCAVWGLFDHRTVEGGPVSMKPLKFALSFVVLFGTLALVERRLSLPVRQGWAIGALGLIMSAAFLAEMVYIIVQAAQAEGSHYNRSTPFNDFMYTVAMAAGAVILIAAVGCVGFLVQRDKAADLSSGLREGIWLGFLLSFVQTLIIAGYLGGQDGHFVGLHPEGAPTVPLLGWSGVTGDLRPAHFFALHAMQVLPIVAIMFDRLAPSVTVRAVRVAALAYAALTFSLFALALKGYPLIPLA